MWSVRLPQLVWAAVSVVFLIYLVFGSIEARIWSSGLLSFREKSIAHVWRYFGDHLPDMPGGPLFPALYAISLVVMVVGTIIGLGLFLLSGDDASNSPLADTRLLDRANE